MGCIGAVGSVAIGPHRKIAAPSARDRSTQQCPPISVGGLTDLGVRTVDGIDLMMTISEAGRAFFDGQGNRLARDRDEPSDRCLDDVGLEASGIGPLQGERVRLAASFGRWTTGFDPEMDGTWSGLPLIGRTNWSSLRLRVTARSGGARERMRGDLRSRRHGAPMLWVLAIGSNADPGKCSARSASVCQRPIWAVTKLRHTRVANARSMPLCGLCRRSGGQPPVDVLVMGGSV